MPMKARRRKRKTAPTMMVAVDQELVVDWAGGWLVGLGSSGMGAMVRDVVIETRKRVVVRLSARVLFFLALYRVRELLKAS